MRVFLDTDVLLDFALGREPHVAASTKLMAWASGHPGQCAVAWHTLANLNYIGRGKVSGFIGDLLKFVEVPRTGREQMLSALDMGFPDLEDAMQVSAAVLFGAQVIVTRNIRDYRRSPIKAMTADEVLKVLA